VGGWQGGDFSYRGIAPGYLASQAVDPARIVNRRLIPADFAGAHDKP